MDGWQGLETEQTKSGVVVSLPNQAPDEFASVVVVKVSGALDIERILFMPRKDGSLVLSADQADIHNNEGSQNVRVQEHEGRPNIGYWTDARAWVEWSFRIERPGRYEIRAELAIEKEKSCFRWGLPDQHVSVEVSSTGGYRNYVTKSLGTIRINKAGEYTLQIKPEKDDWQPINLRQLELKLQ